MAATLGVATLSYLPYAVFNLVSPLLAIAFAYAGIRMITAPAMAEGGSAQPPGPAQQHRG